MPADRVAATHRDPMGMAGAWLLWTATMLASVHLLQAASGGLEQALQLILTYIGVGWWMFLLLYLVTAWFGCLRVCQMLGVVPEAPWPGAWRRVLVWIQSASQGLGLAFTVAGMMFGLQSLMEQGGIGRGDDLLSSVAYAMGTTFAGILISLMAFTVLKTLPGEVSHD